MFDQTFYATVLPDLVKAECAVQPGWLAAACYPPGGPTSRLTTEFVRYELVTRITVSVQEAQTRKPGFDLVRNAAARRVAPQAAEEVHHTLEAKL